MPAQIRSDYPRFPDTFTTLDLQRYYTLSATEHQLALANIRGGPPLLAFVVLLKTCQHLGYFPGLAEVPTPIVTHLRGQLKAYFAQAPSPEPLAVSQPTLYIYHRLIRNYLGIQAFSL